MSLSTKEMNTLFKSLFGAVDLNNKSFEDIAALFHQSFTKQDHFRIGSALVMYLQLEDIFITSEHQRLVAIFLLYEMYRTEHIPANPFASVFIHLLHPPDLMKSKTSGKPVKKPWALPRISNSEKCFLSQLISMPTKDLFKKTPDQIIKMDASDMQSHDVSGLQLALAERHSEMYHTSKSGIPVVLPYPDDKQTEVVDDPNSTKEIQTELLTGPDAAVQNYFKPECIRLAPPLHPFDDELVWMNLTNPAEQKVAWDTTLCANNAVGVEAKRLMQKALKVPLPLNQQHQLSAEIQMDPKLVYHIGISPARLPELVENNPAIAFDVLTKLVQSNQITEYFSVLVNMEMSLHSMEVVNKLVTNPELNVPTEFVHMYINNCINTCESKSQDRYSQNRLVRLICVFLQLLIRSKIIDVQDLFIEVQAFCIEFSHIREAAALFRLLKQIDNVDQVPQTQNTETQTNVKK